LRCTNRRSIELMSAATIDTVELDELLREAEIAHGHLCAGQILGVRMAMLAMRRLGIHSPRLKMLPTGEPNPDRKRPVVFVEIDRCATDAIGVVTGARVGKRALKLRDWGKMAATFVDLHAKLAPDTYKAIRIVALDGSKQRARELYPELEKNAAQMRAYRELPDEHPIYDQPNALGIECTNRNCIVHDPQEGKYTRNRFYLVAEHRLRCFYCETDIVDFVVANKRTKHYENETETLRLAAGHDTVIFADAAGAEAAGFSLPKRRRKAASA